jgi:hypothetical protein
MGDDTTGDAHGGSEAGGSPLPKIDLSTFILSLSTSALYQLGIVEGPGGERVGQPNRLLAQQTIDTIEMLREKMRGNLDDQEAQLFNSLLYELKMRFVSNDPNSNASNEEG